MELSLDELRGAVLAGPVVGTVLRRYPPAPTGGGRVGELVRVFDVVLRSGS